MKIHIVQKGDTLWKIAKRYGVNFEELVKMNNQLSNPDMIMPGMKIRVPTGGVPVKKEAPFSSMPVKEAPLAVHPFAEMPQKPFPVMEEMEQMPEAVLPVKELPVKELPVKEAPKAPPFVPMPQVFQPAYPEIDVNNYYMVNMAMMNQSTQAPLNVLPDMMEPEEVSHKVEEPIESPKAPPIYHQPFYCPPIQPHCCVPISPILPGSGLGFHAHPTPYFPGYSQAFNPQMMQNMPAMEDVEDSMFGNPDIDNPHGMQNMPLWPQFPSTYAPQMAAPYGFQGPQMMPYYQGSDPSNPVMSGTGFSPYGYQPFDYDPSMGMSNPMMDDDDSESNMMQGEGMEPQQGGFAPGMEMAPQQGGFAPGMEMAPQQGGFAPGMGMAPQQGGFAPGMGMMPQQGGFAPGIGMMPQQGGFAPGMGMMPQQGGFAPGMGMMPQQGGFAPGMGMMPQHSQCGCDQGYEMSHHQMPRVGYYQPPFTYGVPYQMNPYMNPYGFQGNFSFQTMPEYDENNDDDF